ncbi:thymidine phosphorylase, partial [Enterobacter cloacae]
MDLEGRDLNGPVFYQYSIDGVGYVASLMFGPMVAACGGSIQLISERGLGHPGGPLAQLDAIPVFSIFPYYHRFRGLRKGV